MELMLQMVKFIRGMKEIEPWKSGTVKESLPGPEYLTDDQLRGKIKLSEVLLRRRLLISHHEIISRRL